MGRWKDFILLHLILFAYSVSSIFSKLAARQQFLSVSFFLCYGMVLLLLGIYSIVWQQVIKKMPLSTAFANKAVTAVWGLLWGVLLFHEAVTPAKLAGLGFVIAGVVLFSGSEEENR